MDILFVGCSHTAGHELKDRFSTRYSKLICDALGANEYNIAEGGRSNDWIARRTVKETRKKLYKRVYVQLTMPSRIEYYTEDGQALKFKINPSFNHFVRNDALHIKSAVEWYYANFYTMRHGIENLYKNKYIIESALRHAVTFTELIFIYYDKREQKGSPSWGRGLKIRGEDFNDLYHAKSHWNQFCEKRHHGVFKDILGPDGKNPNLFGKGGHLLEEGHRKIADYLLSI